MVNAARKYDRIVQVGTHRRSSRMYAQLADVVHSGAIGKVTVARASFTSNMAPMGIGHAPDRILRPVSTGRCGWAHGHHDLSSRRSCPTSFDGGISIRRRWPIGASTILTRSAG